jgi:hypothetical protein
MLLKPLLALAPPRPPITSLRGSRGRPHAADSRPAGVRWPPVPLATTLLCRRGCGMWSASLQSLGSRLAAATIGAGGPAASHPFTLDGGLIAAEWGDHYLQLFLINAAGTVEQSRRIGANFGAAALRSRPPVEDSGRRFEDVFEQQVRLWEEDRPRAAQPLPAILSGSVGSAAVGWCEAPHVPVRRRCRITPPPHGASKRICHLHCCSCQPACRSWAHELCACQTCDRDGQSS